MYYSANGYKRRLQLFFVCLLLAVVFLTTSCKQLEEALPLIERLIERFQSSTDDPVPPADLEENELTLTLYFTDNQAADAMVGGQFGFVMPVTRNIMPSGDPLTAAIEELIAGPGQTDVNAGRTVPETAVVESINLSQGTAVLNFNRNFASDHPGGVLGTQITVESLVYTATEFTAVDRVQVLVEGNPWADGYGFVWNMPIDRAGIAAALYTGEESDMFTAQGNSGGNIVNGGLIDTDGEYIYFSSRTDGGKLYRARPDGSERSKLVDEEARYINVVGEHIYYVAMEDPISVYSEMDDEYVLVDVYGPIVRVNLDGSGRTVISGDSARYLQVSGEWLYYTNLGQYPYHLYRINLDGSNRTLLSSQSVRKFVVQDDWIYYKGLVDHHTGLFRIKTDGSQAGKLYDDNNYYLNVMGNRVYFIGDIIPTCAWVGGLSLYNLDIDGTSLFQVGDIEPMYLNAAGNWLFFYDGQIKKTKPDGSGEVVLAADDCTALFVIKPWLYYTNRADDGRLYRVGIDGSGRKRIE